EETQESPTAMPSASPLPLAAWDPAKAAAEDECAHIAPKFRIRSGEDASAFEPAQVACYKSIAKGVWESLKSTKEAFKLLPGMVISSMRELGTSLWGRVDLWLRRPANAAAQRQRIAEADAFLKGIGPMLARAMK